MATVIFEKKKDNSANSEFFEHDVSGIAINYADMLGWPQGFDSSDSTLISWQINEGGLSRLPQTEVDTFWVQFTIPEDVDCKAPFAGVANVMDGVARRVGWRATESYTFAIDTEHVNIVDIEGSAVFEINSHSQPVQAQISISIPRDLETSLPENFLGSLDHDLEFLACNTSIADDEKLTHGSIVPEYQGYEWQNILVLESSINEWTPVLTATLAEVISFNLMTSGIKCPTLIRIDKIL